MNKMKYQILIVKNRLEEPLQLQKYLVDWFLKYTLLEIELNVIETDFDVTTQPITNGTFTGVVVGSDILPKLRTVIPEGKYNSVLFIYGNDLNGIRVSTCNDSLYPDTEFIQTFKYNDDGKVANHELFHAFFQKLRKCQIGLLDPMDTYIKDSNLVVDNIIDTNREMALKLLTPYWSQICSFRTQIYPNPTQPTQIVTLNRKSDDGIQTLGELSYGNFKCKTLERPWKQNKLNVSCIPKGYYKCKYSFSTKFLKYTYLLQNTSPRSGIRIHSGNFFFDVQGCILLGDSYKDINADGKIDVLNSRATIKKFEEIMNKKEFLLLIN